MLRAYAIDLWLFLRKIALNALIILAILLGSAGLFYLDGAWEDASFLECLINAFYIMMVEAVGLPERWYLEIFVFILPIAAVVVGAEAIVSATVMFVNKSLRRGEWNRVVASTYKDHTVVCGMGELGSALCEGLVAAGHHVVAVDVDEDAPGMVAARQRGVPTVAGDMALPDTLRDANVQQACAVVLCSGNDLTNLEAAIEAQRINPEARVYARVYKESFAGTVSEALGQDINIFSPYATAARAILAEMNDAEQRDPAQQSTPR